MKKVLIAGLALLSSLPALADWQLDNEFSKLNFVSVKKNIIGEAHHFNALTGSLSDAGMLSVTVPLASVETQIPIRNERMQKMLFETALFPTADITAKVDAALLGLAVGSSKIAKLDVDVGLHGVNKMMAVEVMVSRLSQSKLLVTSLKPIIVNPADFGLDKGVDQLMAVAKLPSITQSVPVSFVLTFNAK